MELSMSLNAVVKEETVKQEYDISFSNTYLKQEPSDNFYSSADGGCASAQTYNDFCSGKVKHELGPATQSFGPTNMTQDITCKEEPDSDSEGVIPQTELFANTHCKEEPELDSERVSLQSKLYANHEVKDELVFGPELLHPLETVKSTPQPQNSEATINKKLNLNLDSACTSEDPTLSDNAFICGICSKKFNDKESCVDHLLKHTGCQLYSCEVCNKEFSTKDVFNNHKKEHKNRKPPEEPYTCSTCDLQFWIPSLLVTHKRIHIVEKPYPCNICNKKYSSKSSLKRHNRLHEEVQPSSNYRSTGKYPVNCDICHKTLASKFNLRKHKLIHTGEKPYACEICGRTFGDSSSLIRHKVVHKTISV